MRTQTVVISYCIWIYPPSQDASGRSWRVFWFGFPIPYPLSCLRSCVRDRVSCDRCRAFPLVEMEFRQCVCFPSENAFDKFDDNTDHPWQDAFSELGNNASGMRFLSLEKRIWAAPTLQEAFEMEKCPDAFFEPGKTHRGSSHPSRSIWNGEMPGCVCEHGTTHLECVFFEPRKTHMGSSHPSRNIWNGEMPGCVLFQM